MAQTPQITSIPLYDRVGILSTTTPTEVDFFTTPRGTADPNTGGSAKTFADTNLGTAQRLNEPESFDIQTIQIIFDQGTAEADIDKIFNKSWLEVWTGGGQTLSWAGPTRLITAGMGYQSTTASTVHAQNGAPSPLSVYTFNPVIVVGINENFFVALKFSAVPSLSAAVNVMCVLGGKHYMVDVKDPTGRSLRRSA